MEDLQKIRALETDTMKATDFAAEQKAAQNFFFQGDVKTAILTIDIKEDGNPLNLDNRTVRVAFKKPDGTNVIQDQSTGVTITDVVNGRIEIELRPQVLAAAGKVRGQVAVTEANDTITESSEFSFTVKESLANGAVLSSDDLPILEVAIEAGNILKDVDLQQIVDNTEDLQQAKNDITTLYGQTENLTERINLKGVDVRGFGAKGNPNETTIEAETEAIQSAFDYIKNTQPNFPFSGGKVTFPFGYYKFTEVICSAPHTYVDGEGVLAGALKVRGVETLTAENNIPDTFFSVHGLRWIHDWGHNGDALIFQNMRGATVSNCYFENFRYAIHGEALREDIPYQQTSRVTIDKCKFRNVDYAVRTSYKPWYEGVSANWRYNQHGDWKVIGCQAYFYSRGKTHLWFEGQDGLVCSHNILFHHLYSQQSPTKEYNIYIKQSNFVVITGNDLFEAGYESIYVETPRSLNISNNNIAWCGQRQPSSGIYFDTIDRSSYEEVLITIKGNNIAYPTRHGIHCGYSTMGATVDGNNITKTGSDNFYYGAADLGSVSHYDIFVGDPVTPFSEQDDILVINNFLRGTGTTYQNRGMASNYLLPFVRAKKTFGNINTTPRTVAGVLDVNGIISKQSNPLNEAAPFIMKGVTGTISSVTNAKEGQILTIICGVGTLVLNNSGVGADQLNLGAQVSLSQSQYITLQKTDTYWIKL